MSSATLADLMAEEIRKATLSGEAIEVFHDLRNQVMQMERELEDKTKQLGRVEAAYEDWRETAGRFEASLETANKKVDELTEELATRQEDKLNAAVAVAEAAAFKHSLEVVFKPASVRRTVHKNTSTPVADPQYGGVSYHNNSESEDITEVEE